MADGPSFFFYFTHKAGTDSSQFGTNCQTHCTCGLLPLFMGENMILLFFIQLSSVALLPSLPCTTMFVLSFSVYCIPSSNQPQQLSQITLLSFHILSQG